jgi:hypothetical protein
MANLWAHAIRRQQAYLCISTPNPEIKDVLKSKELHGNLDSDTVNALENE